MATNLSHKPDFSKIFAGLAIAKNCLYEFLFA